MPTLTLINNTVLNTQGNSIVGKQGALTDLITTGYTGLSVLGQNHQRTGQIATATVNTLYNAANDLPATGVYLHCWADQTVYWQFIGTATNFTVKMAAGVPFVLPGFNRLLCAANQTLIAGGAEPATEALQKVVIGNYSGVTANYTLLLCL